MTIKEFATKHKVHIKLDEVGDAVVIARNGEIYDYGKGRFGVMFMLDSVGKWNNRRKECEKAGMRCIQDGETEGTLLFDPEDRDQAKTAIRLVGARARRELRPEQKKAAVERLARFRFTRTPDAENAP